MLIEITAEESVLLLKMVGNTKLIPKNNRLFDKLEYQIEHIRRC